MALSRKDSIWIWNGLPRLDLGCRYPWHGTSPSCSTPPVLGSNRAPCRRGLPESRGVNVDCDSAVVLSLLPSRRGAACRPWLDRVETTRTWQPRLACAVASALPLPLPSRPTSPGCWCCLGGLCVSVIDGPPLTLLVLKVQMPGWGPCLPSPGCERSAARVSFWAVVGWCARGPARQHDRTADRRWTILARRRGHRADGCAPVPPENKAPTQPSWFKQVAAGPPPCLR